MANLTDEQIETIGEGQKKSDSIIDENIERRRKAEMSSEMREHLEKDHPRLKRKSLECWACGAKL